MIEQSKFKKRDKMDQDKKKKWDNQQNYIRGKIRELDEPNFNPDHVKIVAGVDISFSGKFQDGACSALVIYDVDKRKILYEDYQYVKLTQQYIPGFLAFRQLAPTLELFRRLKEKQPALWPEVVLVDGNGIVHQKRCGYACHLGVVLDVPSIGCAKTFFDIDGLHQSQVDDMLYQKLKYQGQHMRLKGKSGKQWCTAIFSDAKGDKNLYISIGNKISLDSAQKLALKLLKYETPEPVRLADKRSRQKIKQMKLQDYNNARSYEMKFLLQQVKKET